MKMYPSSKVSPAPTPTICIHEHKFQIQFHENVKILMDIKIEEWFFHLEFAAIIACLGKSEIIHITDIS